MIYLIVFIGAGLGGSARQAINLFAAKWGFAFPYGTLFINVLGSLLMGIVAEYAIRRGLPGHWRLFLATGILGGFTTFSTFSLETAALYERGEVLSAIAYVLASLIIGVGGLFVGLFLVRQILGATP
jgi:CrcB protein